MHSLSERGKDVIRSMEGWAQTELPRFLKPVDKSWQPSDLLPDSSSPDFLDEVRGLRAAGWAEGAGLQARVWVRMRVRVCVCVWGEGVTVRGVCRVG